MTLRTWVFVCFATLMVTACAEPAGTGAPVAIPSIWVNCTSSQCRTNTGLNPWITVTLTTSGCIAPEFGYERAATVSSISCNTSTGCYGKITGWVDKSNVPSSTIPSGTYSACARIDYNRDYPGSTNGDSIGSLDNLAIGTTTSNQFITIWSDQ